MDHRSSSLEASADPCVASNKPAHKMKDRMKPLLLLGVGRSGTTMTMRMFASHKRIIAEETYPLEYTPMQAAVYPQDTRAQERGAGIKSVSEAYVFYSDLAVRARKQPVYFAEKYPLWRDPTELIRQFPAARFVCIVRDPRDAVLSARALDRRRGFHGFAEKDGDTEEVVAERYVNAYKRLIAKLDSLKAPMFRYEDVMSDPVGVMMGIFRAIDLEVDALEAKAIVDRAHSLEDGRHRTAGHQPTERWRTEMPPRLKTLYADRFGDILLRFGYAVC